MTTFEDLVTFANEPDALAASVAGQEKSPRKLSAECFERAEEASCYMEALLAEPEAWAERFAWIEKVDGGELLDVGDQLDGLSLEVEVNAKVGRQLLVL